VFLQEHFYVQQCTYNTLERAKRYEGKDLSSCLTTIPNFAATILSRASI